MRSCVKRYLELAPGTRLRKVDTPFLPEDQALSPQGQPCASGPCVECHWCRHSFPKDAHTYASEKELEKASRERKKARDEELQRQKEADEKDRGRLAPSAASIVMKILYGARFVRMDLLRIIGFLACSFTRWTSDCDRRLHRLVSYLNATVEAM